MEWPQRRPGPPDGQGAGGLGEGTGCEGAQVSLARHHWGNGRKGNRSGGVCGGLKSSGMKLLGMARLLGPLPLRR